MPVEIEATRDIPPIESLRCFLAAARHLHFRRAARSVSLSPAAFSERIASLEEQLGVTLFERTTRKVRLSPAGERLVPQVERTLEAAEQCRSVATGEPLAPRSLILGTRFELGMSWVLPAVEELEERYPHTDIHLAFGDSPALLELLEDDALDAFVSSARITRPRLVYAPLHEEHYDFVAAPELLGDEPLTCAEDATAHRLLDLHADLPLFRYFLDARPPEEHWRFATVQYLGSIAPVRAMALRGRGVAVLPRYFVEPDIAAGDLVRVSETQLPSDWFRLIWRDGHPYDATLREIAHDLSERPLA